MQAMNRSHWVSGSGPVSSRKSWPAWSVTWWSSSAGASTLSQRSSTNTIGGRRAR